MAFRVDFIGIGSGKCGSTWLWENLVKHPEVFSGNHKELNYFSALYDSQSPAWYASQFAGCPEGQLRGEFSVTYLTHPEAPKRIHAAFPDARLLAVVRDPVKRTFSNYLHSIRKGDISPNLSFDRYIDDEARLVPGRYAEHLERFFEFFEREQLLVIVAERFRDDPRSGYRSLFRHIGAKDVDFFPPGHDERHNEARSYRFLWLENILVRSYRGLNRRGYAKLVNRIIESGAPGWIRAINSDGRRPPQIDEASRRRLAEYFEPFNRRLEELIGQDLSAWSHSRREANDPARSDPRDTAACNALRP